MNFFKGNHWLAKRFAQTKQIIQSLQFISLPERNWVMAPLQRVMDVWNHHRPVLFKCVGAFGVVAVISVSGNQYVQSNMVQVYHVYVKDQEAGIVKDPQVIEQFVLLKYRQLEENHPGIHMKLNTEDLKYTTEKVFKQKADEQTTIQNVDRLLVASPIGAELRVNGKLIGIVKDQETASRILDEIKQKYAPHKKNSGAVSILSAAEEKQQEAGTTELVSEGFVETVDLKITEVAVNQIMDPQDVINKLITGDVQPTKYKVQQGDCVSCIAQKFNISKQLVYQNNPWIEDDRIKVGQELDLTVFQPTLSVKTVEKIVENQEIQHDTTYEKDESLRQGLTKTIKPGKNGLKKVSYMVTKVNGLPMEEELVDEQVIEEPITEVAKKGTKIILGLGSGKFVWPVASAKLSSSFGMRWGRMHKGIDITGNRNIQAADNGEVIYVGDKGDGYGNQILIDHKNGYRTIYGHLSKFYTSKGKIVEKGEKIGYMGSTGDSTGVHLHFEVLKNGTAENPIKYLSR